MPFRSRRLVRRSRPVRRRRPAYRGRRLVSKRYAQRIIAKAGEKKSWDTYVTTTVGTAGTITDLTVMAQGDTDATRDGDQLMLKSLQFRYQLNGAITNMSGATPTAATFSSRVRFMIIQWFPPTTPTFANVLDTGTITAIHAPYDHSSSQKMRVLYDRVHVVQHFVTMGTDPALTNLFFTTKTNSYTQKVLVKIPRRLLQFDTGATTGTGHLYSLFFSDNNSQLATISTGFRVNFVDV